MPGFSARIPAINEAIFATPGGPDHAGDRDPARLLLLPGERADRGDDDRRSRTCGRRSVKWLTSNQANEIHAGILRRGEARDEGRHRHRRPGASTPSRCSPRTRCSSWPSRSGGRSAASAGSRPIAEQSPAEPAGGPGALPRRVFLRRGPEGLRPGRRCSSGSCWRSIRSRSWPARRSGCWRTWTRGWRTCPTPTR